MIILNKRSRFDYLLEEERFEAGIVLLGAEAKSLREGRGDISKSYVKIIGNEVFLINANIPAANVLNFDPTRPKKLLLHRSQILILETKMKQKKLQIVPLKLYNKPASKASKRFMFKLEIALGKPKKQFEKKEALKKRDIQKEILFKYH